MENDIHRYDDIIDRQRPISSKRTPMSPEKRAAQFAPFAALTGYEDAILETGRLTQGKVELTEDAKSLLDDKLILLMEKENSDPMIQVEYFVKDEKKQGGRYVKRECQLRNIDRNMRVLNLCSGEQISLDDIVELDEV